MENFEQQYAFLPLISAQQKVRSSQRSKNVSTYLCLLFGFQLIPHPRKIFYLPFPLHPLRTYQKLCDQRVFHIRRKNASSGWCTFSKAQDKISICHSRIPSISKIKHCMLKQKHIYHNPWKYLAIEMCSKSLCMLQCSFQCICNFKKKILLLLETLVPQSTEGNVFPVMHSSTELKICKYLNQVPISPIPHLLAGKLQPSDGNFTVYYLLLKVCYTNTILKTIPIITPSTSKFHCGMPTLNSWNTFYFIL